MTSFDWEYTLFEVARILEFHEKLQANNKEYWGADDFRNYQLDKYMQDPAHEVGMVFAKLKAHGHAEAVGETPSTHLSNHSRRNDLFRWTPKFYEWLKSRKTLETVTT